MISVMSEFAYKKRRGTKNGGVGFEEDVVFYFDPDLGYDCGMDFLG